MAEPSQKSLDLPPFLQRILPAWITPLWVDSERWRSVVRNQPVAILCRDKLIAYAQANPWDIRARNTDDQDKLQPDIDYYRRFVFREFDEWVDLLWQDTLDLPIGGNTEIVRWPDGVLPAVEMDGEEYRVTRPNPKGHVFKLVNIDGATLVPTYDPQIPMAQRIPQNMSQMVFFTRKEIGRILLTPRPEIRLKGYSMPPPQKIFLAITMLYHGDRYYSNLLLDTPEAGILDMPGFTKSLAQEWVQGFQNLMGGIDPMKIGVAYEHQGDIKWIPFTRPPTEMMYDTTTLRYGRYTAAGYWLTLSDVGLEPDAGGTLAGQIRRQREARLTGYGIVKEKTKNLVDNDILPPYLEFNWVERDDEAMSNLGRARLLNIQALSTATKEGLLPVETAQEQLKKDGLLSVEIKPVEPLALPQPKSLPPGQEREQAADDQTETERDRVPPSQGGRGDIGVTRAELQSRSKSADRLKAIFEGAFDGVAERMGEPQLRRLIKAATRAQFKTTSKALIALSESERAEWVTERVKCLFGEPSVFDDVPQIKKADQETLDELEKILDDDKWWEIGADLAGAVAAILILAYSKGAEIGAEDVLSFLYEEGLLAAGSPIKINFELKNPVTLREIEASAAQLVRRVNDGTKFYLKRIILSGVDEGLASQEIAARIREGAAVEEILRDGGFADEVVGIARREAQGMSRSRADSVTNTEINKAESMGRLGQWRKMGLTKKRWKTTVASDVCPICQGNEALGLVDLDHVYEDVFDGTLTPPAHPQVCRCHLKFDEDELIGKAGELKVWAGD